MKILVVGGSSGLGAACAAALACDHDVTAVSRRGEAPHGCQSGKLDLATVDSDWEGLQIPWDAALLAAGMGAMHRPDRLRRIDLDRLVQVNLVGTVKLLNDLCTLARLRKQPFRVVAATSTAGDASAPGLGPYAAAKKGVEGWIRSEGPRFARRGVHALAASLPWFESPMTASIVPWVRDRAARRQGRFLTLAEATAFTLDLLLGTDPGGTIASCRPRGSGRVARSWRVPFGDRRTWRRIG